MMANFITSENECRLLAARRVERDGIRARESAHRVSNNRIAAGRLTERRKNLQEHHPEWDKLHTGQIVTAILMCLLPIAAWGIDFFLLGSVAEYCASLVVSDPTWIALAKALIPAAIVCVEVYTGARIDAERELARRGAAD